jgi:hypothetical protein
LRTLDKPRHNGCGKLSPEGSKELISGLGLANIRRADERSALLGALIAFGADPRRVRRFLEGLSADELRYIADFQGASLLDPELRPAENRQVTAARIEKFQKLNCRRGPQTSQKMILLLEFLSLTRIQPRRAALAARAGAA